MRERLLEGFKSHASSKSSVTLLNEQGYHLSVDVVEYKHPTYRVRLTGPAREGPLNSFFKEHKAVRSTQTAPSKTTTASLQCYYTEAVLDWKSSPVLTIRNNSDGSVLHSDLPNRAYNLSSSGIRHYSRMNRQDVHFGLGEVAGPINLTGRRFEIRTSDSACYDSFETDPLYKHTPFLVNVPRKGGICTAYYSASLSDSIWDVGKSVDEPWGAFKSFEVETGGLEFYIFHGSLQEISVTFAWLTGSLPLMPPRWSLGYLSSSMGLAESVRPIFVPRT